MSKVVVELSLEDDQIENIYRFIVKEIDDRFAYIDPDVPHEDVVKEIIQTLYQSSLDTDMFETEFKNATNDADFLSVGVWGFDWLKVKKS